MLPKNIWIINLAGLLCNISTSIMYGISSSFLRTVVGVNAADIGFFQGMIDTISYATKLGGGFFSDFFQKRRLLIILGIALVTITKPMLAMVSSVSLVFLARALDRFGNGIQATPRDALIGDLCPKDMRGRCYGLRNTLTILGSVLGSFLGIKMMFWTNGNFSLIFAISTIPALLALIFAIFFVPDSFVVRENEKKKFTWSSLKVFDKSFWVFMFVTFVFLTFRYNETILAVKATEELGLSHNYSAVVFMVYNLSICLLSYPLGALSDKIAKEKVLLGSFFLSMIAHLCCGFATSLNALFIGVVLWGAQMGISNAMLFSLTANQTHFNLRGTAFSIFYFVAFLATILSSVIFRFSCQYYGLQAPFLIGSIGTLVAAILLFTLLREKFKKEAPLIESQK